MKNVINKNYVPSELLIKLVELVADKLNIEIPSADDLAAFENEQDERYIIFNDIYNCMIDTLQIDEQVFQALDIEFTGDLLMFYVAYHTESH